MACVNGHAGIYPCQNVDLLSVLPLSAMGCADGNSLWGWTDSLDGKEYALMGCDNGISFVDISAPESPLYLGRLPTHSFDSIWRDVKVYANHAFIVSEASSHGMQVFDLTQLRSVPSPPVIFSETAHYPGFGSSHTIALDEATGFAYAAGSDTCAGGLHMVNVQDPPNPVFAGCVSSDGYTHETQCVIYDGPDSTYSGHEICFSSNEDTLTIVDVSNKSAPIQLSRKGYAGSGYVHQGWLTEDHIYFLLDDEVDELNDGHNTYTYIWNVSDLNAPVLMGHYTGPTPAIDHNLYVRGGYAYEGNYRAGLRILDVTGIAATQLFEAGFFDVYPPDDLPEFNGVWNNYPFFSSGNVIVSGIEQGLFVLHPTVNPNPTSIFIGAATITEGNTGTTTLSFPVTLSVGIPQEVSVSFATAPGSATSGVDYVAGSGLVTFAPTVTAQTIDITVNGDLFDEIDETLTVNLTDPTNASLAVATATGTILDDDTLAVFSVSPTSGDAAGGTPFSITGTAFEAGTSVFIGGVPVSDEAVLDPGQVTGTAPALLPGTLNDVVAIIPRGITATLAKGWLADFLDVPSSDIFHSYVEKLFRNEVTVGCLDGNFCRDDAVTRAQMAVFLLKSKLGSSHVPPPATGTVFADVHVGDFAADWIEELASLGITAGCDDLNYCPDQAVSRAQMAVLLLKTALGTAYVPPQAVEGVFDDVHPGDFAADWIEDLFGRGITGGCQLAPPLYCPDDPNTRGQMAVFLVKTFDLQ
ncbi:MAG: choice-of-anchor B family protein [Acidobacteriota bacterium]